MPKRRSYSWRSPVETKYKRIRSGDLSPSFGRRYATYLANVVDLIDEHVGRSQARKTDQKATQSRNTRIVVHAIHRAHPEWSMRQIGDACGMSAATVCRYLKDYEE